MSAIRLPLLCAFAGGCLSNALLFGLWHVSGGGLDSAVEQPRRSRNVVEFVTAASAAPSVARVPELNPAAAADPGHDSATEAAPVPVASDLDGSASTPAGSAVSDVLTRLEAAYRERVAPQAPAQPSLAQEGVATPAPALSAAAAAEAAPSIPAQSVPAVTPVALAALAPAATTPPVLAQVAATAPAALVPQVAATAPAALAPQVAAVPAVALQDGPPPTEIHYGDINQNTYVTNVREGDVYQIQMQQIAVLQYIQALGMSGLGAAARPVARAGHQRGTLSSGITNPDNPWGFHFAPPNLVR